MTTVSAYESNDNSTVSTYFQIDESWKLRTGKGVSIAVIDSGIESNHPDLQGFRRWILATRDAHALYEKFGFTGLKFPERWMEKSAPNAY